MTLMRFRSPTSSTHRHELIWTTFCRFARDTRATTSIEYGLIGVLVGIAMIAGLTSFGDETTGMWTFVRTTVISAISG